jgi:hypothetical protein
LSYLKSTKPRPIKVTDQIPTSDDKADKKAVEIAKTGKVTTVVMVMHLYSDSKSKLVIKITKNSAKETKFGSKLKKLGLEQSKKHLKEALLPLEDAGKRLLVKQKTIRVLLDTGSSGDLLFLKKGSNNYIPVVNRAVPESWGTSNGTFITKKVGEIELSFINNSVSKRMHPPRHCRVFHGGPKAIVQPYHRQTNLT